MRRIIGHLEQWAPLSGDFQVRDPFQLLIATILSQNTSDSNSSKAYETLSERFEVTPKVIAHLQPEDIKPLITCAGLQEIKSKRIVAISQSLLDSYNGDLMQILNLPLNEARKTLIEFKGIGPKTADILLLFVGNKFVFPIDTNIFRVVKRMGFIIDRNYERSRKVLESLIPQDRLKIMHFDLIKLGREICKPQRPRCSICMVNTLCDYGVALLKEVVN
ncbi:MAG: endonuclease III [Candidatus Bathyarchaeota archaeon]|nr:MAG: endonuclease III [Candidatus Bathyarchaeota archaeon]